MRGATLFTIFLIVPLIHFNPHSPCGERPLSMVFDIIRKNFNPHSPCGERLALILAFEQCSLFQSTLPMRGATKRVHDTVVNGYVISIHTPHAGSDLFVLLCFLRCFQFQSTLPMRGATTWRIYCNFLGSKFQSTLPMRGATALYR